MNYCRRRLPALIIAVTGVLASSGCSLLDVDAAQKVQQCFNAGGNPIYDMEHGIITKFHHCAARN